MEMQEIDAHLRGTIWLGDMAGLRAALQDGANPNARNQYNWTSLHVAAHVNNAHAAHALILAGADETLKEHHGCTPALLAEERGNARTLFLINNAQLIRERAAEKQRRVQHKPHVIPMIRKYKL